MIEINRLNKYFESLSGTDKLSIPSKTILLEEGKVADRLFFIHKGALRLFFYNEGKDITFQFFFEGDFVASFDSLYKRIRGILRTRHRIKFGKLDPKGDRDVGVFREDTALFDGKQRKAVLQCGGFQ